MQAGIHRYAGNTICLSAARAKLIFNTLFRAIKLRRPPISLSITVGSPCGARFPRIGITVAETLSGADMAQSAFSEAEFH
ncbi:MAG: hypothetical protein JMDDDDMK_02272 [Acidobacteria bacterium]|nr:hypothetical protein [Acidobacteriota bacterium]